MSQTGQSEIPTEMTPTHPSNTDLFTQNKNPVVMENALAPAPLQTDSTSTSNDLLELKESLLEDGNEYEEFKHITAGMDKYDIAVVYDIRYIDADGNVIAKSKGHSNHHNILAPYMISHSISKVNKIFNDTIKDPLVGKVSHLIQRMMAAII